MQKETCMNTQTAVDQTSTQYPQGNGSGTVEEPPIGTPPAGEGGEPAVQRLKSERVQEELKAMPAWELAHEEKAIERAKSFPTPEVAALYTAYVTGYAAAAGFAVTVNVTGGQVCVTVYAPQINGCAGELTESVLGFARQL
jgi:pterin-4a-carbinolamine dehydratase